MLNRASDDEIEATCACGAVALKLRGEPIESIACYCETCQDGSRRIEALPNAPCVRELDGGTAYVVYRKDRVTYARGGELLTDVKLEQDAKTNRVAASCCNSAMLMRFDDARHWIPVYRARLGSNAPALQIRICTSDMPGGVIANDLPTYRNYPPAFMLKLLVSRLAMRFGS